LGAVETPDVGGGLRIGEVERAAAEQIGLERNPGMQVGAGLDDHAGAGRAGHVETKYPIRKAKRGVVCDDKGCENCGNNYFAIAWLVRAGDARNLGENRYGCMEKKLG
jgi:hypothetical protein